MHADASNFVAWKLLLIFAPRLYNFSSEDSGGAGGGAKATGPGGLDAKVDGRANGNGGGLRATTSRGVGG